MNKEQKTIAEIQKAVPDIMELKFGCEVKVKEKLDTCSHYYNATILQGYEDCVRVYGVSIQDENLGKFEQVVEKIDIIKIIGRPITLEDVLVALPEEDSKIREDKYKCEDCGYDGKDFTEEGAHISDFYYKCPKCKYGIGDILTRFWSSEVEEIVRSWGFGKPFTEQSKETKELIGDLICKE